MHTSYYYAPLCWKWMRPFQNMFSEPSGVLCFRESERERERKKRRGRLRGRGERRQEGGRGRKGERKGETHEPGRHCFFLSGLCCAYLEYFVCTTHNPGSILTPVISTEFHVQNCPGFSLTFPHSKSQSPFVLLEGLLCPLHSLSFSLS